MNSTIAKTLLLFEIVCRIRPKVRAGQFSWWRAAGMPGANRLAISLVALLAAMQPAAAEWHGRAIDLMGTRVSVELWHENEQTGLALVEQVLDEYRRIDRLMSTYLEDSEISRVNREAANVAVPIGDELLSLIRRSIDHSRASDGAFDISYESVGYLYDFRARQHPNADQIAALIDAVDYRRILVDAEARTVRFGMPNMRINLGGIAKGYAVEQGARILRDAGVEHALLNAGGDTRVIGDRRGQPWIIGIRHPRLEDDVATRLPIIDEAISTSGDYERFFEEDGRRYHHILNPATGEPTETLLSATVIGPDATLTDALATTVFVLGADNGLALIDRYPGYEAIVVEPTGQLRYSGGLVAPE
jgi:thiamine biosynthesis lipoprotein